jgi:hypothetical protein
MADEKPTTSEEDGKNTEGKPEGKDTPPKPEDAPKFTQADLDRVAAKTRDEERRKAKEVKDKEDRERLEAKAKEQGEFEKLASSHKAKLDEIEPKLEATTKELDAYREEVSKLVKAKLKALPEEVRDISPAQFAEDKSITNPLDVLAWLPKGEALAEKLEGKPVVYGAGKDPKPTGGTPGKAYEQAHTTFLNSGKYGF